jgi:predicted metal-dependent hydrolase
LRICSFNGLEIITPARFNFNEIPALLEKHRGWIERTYRRLKPSLTKVNEPEIPSQILFSSLQQTWQLHLHANEQKKITIHVQDDYQLLLTGPVNNNKLVKHILRSWLQHYAYLQLLPWLQKLSQQSQLPFARASVRHAKTLWGSCSAKKNISLNCRLLFLPAELVEYVILHELCHTVQLNHSRHFWELLKKFNPKCLELRQQLRQADQYLPRWLHDEC